MKNVKFVLIALGALVALNSCKKDEDDHDHDHDEENKSMQVTIDSPTEGQNFNLGEDVTISGSASANFEMHGYEVKLINESNNDSILFENFTHQHEENISFSETWTNNVDDHSDIRVEVSSLGDHEGTEKETESVHIHCHPM